MNILIFSWRGPGHSESGGAEISTHEHAKAWVRAGHSVTLFTSFFKKCRKEETIDGIRVIRRGGDVLGVQVQAFFWYLFGEHLKFDLVVDQFHGIPFFTPLYVRTKKLAFIHEVAKEVWWFNPWPKPFNLIPAIIGTVFERFMFMILYRRTPFMTVSESTKAELVAWGIPGKNITVIHNGVSVVKVDVKKEKRNTLIYLGALTKDKGVEDAISVFSYINKKDPPYRFWIVGGGEKSYVDYLKNQIKKSGLGGVTKFWGHVSDSKRDELLARSHILVNPSIREGWGLVNIEANSAGTPVAGYNVSGMRDSVLNNSTGRLVKYGDVESLALAILELCKDDNRYSGFRQMAIDWSKKFTWSKSGQMSLKLVDSI